MNLDSLRLEENIITPPSEPEMEDNIEMDEIKTEQRIIPRYTHINTRRKFKDQQCGSILKEEYISIGLCKRHQSLKAIKGTDNSNITSPKSNNNKPVKTVVQKPKPNITSPKEEQVDDSIEQIDLPSINIKVPVDERESTNNENIPMEEQPDLSQQGNINPEIENKIQDLYKHVPWLNFQYPFEARDSSISSEEYYEFLCKEIEDKNLDVLVFYGYMTSVKVLEAYLINNHGLNLKGWSNSISGNGETRY
jgi:hypothetical protein